MPPLPLPVAAQVTAPSGPPSPANVTIAAPTNAPPDAPDVPRRLRNGVVVGFAIGGGLGGGAGYPNDLNDIGKRNYASSGWMPGYGGTILVMGALADYLNFGFWYAHENFKRGESRAVQDGVGLRIEGFPFVVFLPQVVGLEGLGVFSEFGVGVAKLQTQGNPQVGGTQSFIGVGAFYEWSFAHLLGGHLGVGPSLEYDAIFTQPYDQNGVVATIRFVFYGRP